MPDIYLIVMDDCRFDRLSCNGYHRKTTPFIDSIALKGASFKRVYATSASTISSHVSMLTGKYVFQHGVSSRYQRLDNPLDILSSSALDGYAKHAIIANPFLFLVDGIDKGWDTFSKEIEESDDGGISFALDTVKDVREHDSPNFFCINLITTHSPFYFDKPAYVPVCTVEEYKDIDFSLRHTGIKEPDWTRGGFSSEKVEPIVNRYDSAVHYLDSRLPEFNFMDNDIVIITSDHGEMLGEHLLLGHSTYPYDQVIHVPLITNFRVKPGNTGSLISLRHIYDLVCASALGKTGDIMISDGAVLIEQLCSTKEVSAEKEKKEEISLPDDFSFRHLKRSYRCLFNGRYKLVQFLDEDRCELYDVIADPEENVDILNYGLGVLKANPLDYSRTYMPEIYGDVDD